MTSSTTYHTAGEPQFFVLLHRHSFSQLHTWGWSLRSQEILLVAILLFSAYFLELTIFHHSGHSRESTTGLNMVVSGVSNPHLISKWNEHIAQLITDVVVIAYVETNHTCTITPSLLQLVLLTGQNGQNRWSDGRGILTPIHNMRHHCQIYEPGTFHEFSIIGHAFSVSDVCCILHFFVIMDVVHLLHALNFMAFPVLGGYTLDVLILLVAAFWFLWLKSPQLVLPWLD